MTYSERERDYVSSRSLIKASSSGLRESSVAGRLPLYRVATLKLVFRLDAFGHTRVGEISIPTVEALPTTEPQGCQEVL